MKTRLEKDKGKDIVVRCGLTKFWELPREGFSGCLLLGCLPKQNLRITFESKDLVHAGVLDNRGNPLSITFVYGHPEHSKREEVWLNFKALKAIAHHNWLCIGDFNQILTADEKLSFNQGKIVRVDTFQQTISE